MSYTIQPGLPETKLKDWLMHAAKQFGTFKDGRVDYTKADEAPIVMCTVVYKDKILLCKRGYGLADAEGYWSTINGFIDEIKPVKAIAAQELQEEIGIQVEAKDIKVASSYTLTNPAEKRRYIVFACLIILSTKPIVVLDHEHTDHKWIKRDELKQFDILDDLPHAIDAALALA
jgi:NADH pyrophosphatase NudC (nudix superfamily)